MTTITKALHGHTITIDDEQMRFHVIGPIINDLFASYREADEAIKEAVAKHEAQTRKRISIIVLDEKGNPQTITGVHAGNGKILGLPDNTGYGGSSYYPNVTWIAESIKRAQQLRTEFIKEEKRTDQFKMSGSGYDLPAGTHAEKVENLLAMVAAKTKAATEHGG